jgi:predicted KAP-like P-loop ATPase
MPTLQQTDSPFRRDSASLCDSDAFAHADVAKVLVGAIQEAPSPFTIGLFGGWGTGKSTVLESVAARLAAVESTAYVAFDVWKYEGDSLRRQFIREVARQLKADDASLSERRS